MNYQEVLTLLETEETVLQLLIKLQPIFEKINACRDLFQTNSISASPEECKKTLDELTGLYMYLNPIYSLTISAKQNKEDEYYVERRTEMLKELDGKRFISAALDKEASTHVKNYRLARNLLQSYTNACDKAISSCQSILKYSGEEIKLNK